VSSERTNVIEVQELVKVYGGDARALDGVSFEVSPGELFGFLGPNGAGKTTTIRILATLLRATSGTARVAGFDVAHEPEQVRQRLGIALQTPTLDAFSTGRETLELSGRLHRMPGREVRRRADELLELMGLTAVAKKLTGTYSGGMKRRLDLAAALMHRPELLILDEPTEGLDPQSRTALWEELERIGRSGTTMLLTTHYMEEADRLCSRLAIVDTGRIVAGGSPADLKRSVGADTVVLQLDPVDESERAGAVGAAEHLADTIPAAEVPAAGSRLPEAGGPQRAIAAAMAAQADRDGGRDEAAPVDEDRGRDEAAPADGAGPADEHAAGEIACDGNGNGHRATVMTVRRLLDGMVEPRAVCAHPAGVTLAVPNANDAIPVLLRRLEGNGLQITGLQMTQPSLDDVFLKYTGRHIRTEAADQPIILGW
jgi:ABC-2 type transport system ATP-binding protein